MYSLGIGLIKNTDIKLRWVPKVVAEDYEAKLFGIGIMHDIKQWIPGMGILPFDLSVFAGTTLMSIDHAVNVDEAYISSTGTVTYNTTLQGEGAGKFRTSATTAQAIVSKKMLFFTPYAAIGFNAVKTTYDLSGDYTYSITSTDQTTNTTDTQTILLQDPIGLEFTGAGGPRLTIGARIKLLVFTLHGAYTFQKYNTLSLGLGVSVR